MTGMEDMMNKLTATVQLLGCALGAVLGAVNAVRTVALHQDTAYAVVFATIALVSVAGIASTVRELRNENK